MMVCYIADEGSRAETIYADYHTAMKKCSKKYYATTFCMDMIRVGLMNVCRSFFGC